MESVLTPLLMKNQNYPQKRITSIAKKANYSYLALFGQSMDEIICSCVVDIWYQNRGILRDGGPRIFIHRNLYNQDEHRLTGPREKLKRAKLF